MNRLRRWWHDKAAMWLAFRLPKWVAYWAMIRVVAYATSGKYGDTDVTTITYDEVAKRYEAQL